MAGKKDIELLLKYFPELRDQQVGKFERMYDLYADWNEKVNLISRKDFENFYLHHVLHSLGLGKIIAGKKIHSLIDIGTGGGFPGIPLAILFPGIQFLLVDSIKKKINVVKEIKDDLGLKNVRVLWERAENIRGEKFDIVTGRAVTNLPSFLHLSHKLLNPGKGNGLYYFKGGELEDEIKTRFRSFKIYQLGEYFKEDFFDSKYIIYFPSV